MGLTERGLQDIGDVTKVVQSSATSRRVEKGQELLQIHFEGHSITSADELYHTVWETFSDQINIVTPIAGSLGENEIEQNADSIDEESVLVTLEVDETEFQQRRVDQTLVHELQYLKMVQSMGPGKFSD